jgi:hypothetical protein
MLRIEMLPAAEGDALWIEYGHPNAPMRILVDGGPARTYHALRARILALPPAARRFELVIVTHIDTDHVDGIIRLLRDSSLELSIGDIWFNGYPQLIEADTQGPGEGEILGTLIQRQRLNWNAAFDHRAVVVDDGFTQKPLPGGMMATIVGPTRVELDALLGEWDKVLAEESWVPGDEERALAELEERKRLRPLPSIGPLPDELGGGAADVDPSKANGSSIALILQDPEGRRCLLTGDAHAPVLAGQLERLGGGEPVKVHAFKLPHHGSRNNVSDRLLAAVATRRYLVSSSGSKYQHPDQVAIERVLQRHADVPGKPTIDFNYRSAYNEEWADPDLQRERRYVARYPEGLVVGL